MDTRWQNLPYVHHAFTPKTYPDCETWEAERERIRKQVLFAAGLWPLPEKPLLDIHIWHRLERDGYTVEKVYFQSLPGFYVGGSLFRPIDPKSKSHPGIVQPHGHGRVGRLGHTETASYQARGLTFARMGCTSFMWDMVDYNDSARHLSGAYQDENYGVVHRAPWPHRQDDRMLWGIGILGLQLWNSIRALDFICELPEVDTSRLGCTGESGGGTQTYNLYAVDDRLAVAAPVCMVSAFMQGGCVCENAPLLRIDTNNVDIGATFAPRPLILVNSAQDWTKNTPNVEYPAIKRIYELYDAGDKVSQVQIDAPHGYNQDMREAVYRWFAKWLDLPFGDDFTEPPFEVEKREDLLAFWDGLPFGAITNHEDLIRQCIDTAKQTVDSFKPDTAEALANNREVLGEALRIAVGYDDSAVGYEREGDGSVDDLNCEDGVLIGEQRNVRVPLRTFGKGNAATLLIHPQGIRSVFSPLVKSLVAKRQTVYAIDPFGIGGNIGEQDPESPRGSVHLFNTYNRVDNAERVYDIVLALRHILSQKPESVTVVGFHGAGLWTLLAGAVADVTDQRVRFVVDADQFDTAGEADYLSRLPIPSILKAGGLPNAAALISPNALYIHNTGEAFDISWAEAAYALDENAHLTVEKEQWKNDALIAVSD